MSAQEQISPYNIKQTSNESEEKYQYNYIINLI